MRWCEWRSQKWNPDYLKHQLCSPLFPSLSPPINPSLLPTLKCTHFPIHSFHSLIHTSPPPTPPTPTTPSTLIPTNTALISSLSPTPRSPSPAACESSGSSSRRPSRTPPSARFHSPAPRSLHVTLASPLPVGRSSVRTTILSTSFASSKEPSARTDRSTPPLSSTRIHANRFASKPHPSRSS